MLRVSDGQRVRIRRHFLEERFAADRPGRRPIPARRVLEALLWILNTGAQWHMLPQSYPNYKTVHRRFQEWGPSLHGSSRIWMLASSTATAPGFRRLETSARQIECDRTLERRMQ